MPIEISLIELPGVADVENMRCGVGEWRSDAEIRQRADEVSIALFGVTAADTRKEPIDSATAMGSDRHFDREKYLAIVEASRGECEEWEQKFRLATAIAEEAFGKWILVGPGDNPYEVDLTGADGQLLACTSLFVRQLLAALYDLVPGAHFTPDGSGRHQVTDLKALEASLTRDARAFRPAQRR